MEDSDKERANMERKKLQDIKWMTQKVLKERESLEDLFDTEEILSARKVSELREVGITLERKLLELQTEIEITEMKMETKMKEVECLTEDKERDSNICDKFEDYWKKYNETVVELEAEVKREYLEYQNERDIKMLLEAVRNKLSEENIRPVLVEILRRKKEYAEKRKADFLKAKDKLNEEKDSLLEENEKLKKKVNILEQRYQSLLDVYAMSKRAKEAAQHTLAVCPRWAGEKAALVQAVRRDLSLPSLVREILRDDRQWAAFQRFAEDVLQQKEAVEGVRERTVQRRAREGAKQSKRKGEEPREVKVTESNAVENKTPP